MADSTLTAGSDPLGPQVQTDAAPGPGRRRLWGALAAGVVLVVIGAGVLLRSGGGGAGRLFPAPSEVIRALNDDGLKVSRIRDFVIGSDDIMFVAVSDDEGSRSLLSVSRSGNVSTLLRTEGKHPVNASALALAGNGDIYVADADKQSIVVRAKNGKIREIGSFAPASGASDTDPGLDSVDRMALDPASGDVYLADDNKIDRLDSKGQLSTVAGARRTYGDKSGFPPDTFVPDSDAPRSGPAKAVRFIQLKGLTFDPDDGALYATNGFALVRVGKDGTAEVVRSNARFVGNSFYDPTRKNLYVGAETASRDGIARVNKQREVLVLPGTEGSIHISDRIGADSRGNVYWLHEASGAITAAGDVLSETRLDLKGVPRKVAAPPKSPASDGKLQELFDARSVAQSLGAELRGEEFGPVSAGRDGTVYFAVSGNPKTRQDDRLIAVPRSGKPEVLTEEVVTTALSVSDDGTLYAAQWGVEHHALYFRRPGGEWRSVVDYRPQYSAADPDGNSLQDEAFAIAIDEVSKDIYLSDGQVITRVDQQGRLNRVAGVHRAAGEPFPPVVADGTAARDARFGFVVGLAVDPTSHDLFIQNGYATLKMSPDGTIHTVKDPATGYPLSTPYNGFGFDRERRTLLVRDTSKPEQSVASVSLEGKVSPIPPTVGQIGNDDAFWATSDGAIYIWQIKSGKVRYVGPGT